MTLSKILQGAIFVLVLVLAWMFLGGSSGYYDTAPGTAASAAVRKAANRARKVSKRARRTRLKPRRVCMNIT